MAEIPKSYDPQGVEQRWYDLWVSSGCFKGKVDPAREPFAVMIPPPNVTGVLHMGHLLNNTLQDIMVRRARQEGKSALWLPGTDHAGIATQSRVERELKQKQGKTRHDLGREKFLEAASEWRDKHGGIILSQLRKLGASCDWDRTVHTLDAGYSQAVLQAFVTLYERGYVYRGKRMVNWCPVSQ
ncbi:MAG: class I tRNA ligase family protein, partial [Opitutales bacterium]